MYNRHDKTLSTEFLQYPTYTQVATRRTEELKNIRLSDNSDNNEDKLVIYRHEEV